MNGGTNLYNKYRPQNFGAVIGQGQVTAILRKQSQLGAWGHSYLFYGASGTGKTTTARILAATLNCTNLNGTGEPCGVCPSCRNTQDGNHWDVLEIDGARFSGVGDCRELAYKLALCPYGNRKIVILDECHRLSPAAWDSLLKIIEEPPPHLIFILCSTEVDKIPVTIQSRCQLFEFRPLTVTDIRGKLEAIVREWGLSVEGDGLNTIATWAMGNMRQAENRLEQVIVCAV